MLLQPPWVQHWFIDTAINIGCIHEGIYIEPEYEGEAHTREQR